MRYLTDFIIKDLIKKKLVLLGGPRQSGKTTLAQYIGSTRPHSYLNWDFLDHRLRIKNQEWPDEDELIILDELHKFRTWKNWLKGVYDVKKSQHHFLVTGSARLDTFQKGGDSLVGRYHYWRLHPFSLHELPKKMTYQEAISRFMTCGGFPEPFLDGNEREASRWRRERELQVVREDLRDLSQVSDISKISLLLRLLSQRVGSLIVFSHLAQDLEVSSKTIKQWVSVLEQLHLIFIVRPFQSKKINRSLIKPCKIYFWDNAAVEGDEGAVFENLIAIHLLKEVHFRQDYFGEALELTYVRDKEKREVDFCLSLKGQAQKLIEVKLSETQTSQSLLYFAQKIQPKNAIQVVMKSNKKVGTYQGIQLLTPKELFRPEVFLQVLKNPTHT